MLYSMDFAQENYRMSEPNSMFICRDDSNMVEVRHPFGSYDKRGVMDSLPGELRYSEVDTPFYSEIPYRYFKQGNHLVKQLGTSELSRQIPFYFSGEMKVKPFETYNLCDISGGTVCSTSIAQKDTVILFQHHKLHCWILKEKYLSLGPAPTLEFTTYLEKKTMLPLRIEEKAVETIRHGNGYSSYLMVYAAAGYIKVKDSISKYYRVKHCYSEE